MQNLPQSRPTNGKLKLFIAACLIILFGTSLYASGADIARDFHAGFVDGSK